MSIFLRSLVCFRVPHLCSKMPKINKWSMDSGVHSVCFRGDFAIKTVSHVQAFIHLFLCNTFCGRLILLSLSLYIELALVCCTNPNNVNCFGDYIPESKLCFCVNLSRPPGPYWIRPIQKLLNRQTRTRCQCYSIHPDWGTTKNSAVALVSRNNMLSIHQRSARTNEGKTTLI